MNHPWLRLCHIAHAQPLPMRPRFVTAFMAGKPAITIAMVFGFLAGMLADTLDQVDQCGLDGAAAGADNM